MDKKRASKELFESFLRLVNKYNALGKHPMTYGTQHQFYHSERHMLDIVGEDPGLNITEFAKAAGVTKGAISQVVSKLEKKGALKRFKRDDNNKEIQLKLTRQGEQIYANHQRVNEEAINHLWRELKKHPSEKTFVSQQRARAPIIWVHIVCSRFFMVGKKGWLDFYG